MSNMGRIRSLAGTVIRADRDQPVSNFEVARVGNERLLGEVIRIDGTEVDIQVYEEIDGVHVGEPVEFTGELLGIDLGPGLLGSVLDGIGRPLLGSFSEDGVSCFLKRGFFSRSLDTKKKWEFTPIRACGDAVLPGDVIGSVIEGEGFRHLILVPPGSGPSRVKEIAPGDRVFSVDDTVCLLESGQEISLCQRWHVRTPRPCEDKLSFSEPLITGQRVLDTLFPVALGGAAVVPGGFGTGKTVTQQSLAKWCNAEVVVYIGCGERGNEMTEVLEEFPHIRDPHTGRPLMDRMVLIANTSNMPVAAREASIYLGMTIAEYFRDMGLDVALMADSTSRWAEALREISGRLGEMPGEEGYPAYLGSRLAQYYERAGRVMALGEPRRKGSITIFNAVSPGGGDFSEPVTQASLRLSGAFWALDKRLAESRHFPSINWKQSYSLYEKALEAYFMENLGKEWRDGVSFLRELLDRETELLSLVQIVGRDALSEQDKWDLEMGEIIRITFLQQNAFDPLDAFNSLERQMQFAGTLKDLHELVREEIKKGVLHQQIQGLGLLRRVLSLRGTSTEEFQERSSAWLDDLTRSLSGLEGS
ncbi:MAG: V-type ATP synthase subunit A [Thermovirgaceae bacterium]|jgi:V/A-type H+-transporting ATPase subunit A|nr:V-type ATP synthase subunit A [Synergistales bacterium]HRW87880.1 V-type ATP synthase subunit A [Thermovirgaceae bacterium]MDD3134172.1 V-type ATP synthase subunit A [Synergistales bacterium]MDD3829331.1 V-type ATP synthase subunit A [Synergistales bacterium]MDD4024006.1 V-type ATP synthase subunit A [Synergistales bacterium]